MSDRMARLRSTKLPVTAYSGVTLAVLLVMGALVVSQSSPDPREQNLTEILQSPSSQHLLGTDQLGRDQLSRVGQGLRNSVFTILVVVAVSGIGGGLIGLLSGYRGGLLDLVLQRVVEVQLALPLVVLVLAVVTAVSAGFWSVALSIGFAFAPLTIRLSRSSAITLKRTDYVAAAHLSGASETRIVVRHLVPNSISPWAIVVASQAGAAVLVEAALAFLGFAPGRLTLGGLMGGEAQTYMYGAPWLIIWPGVAVALLTLAANLIGEWAADSSRS